MLTSQKYGQIAGNELYGSSYHACRKTPTSPPQDPCARLCSSDNCNTDYTGKLPFPPTTTASKAGRVFLVAKGRFRLCYNGLADSESGYLLRGGIDDCQGLCVTYLYAANESRVFGCAPFELPELLGTSDNNCITLGDLTTCFCSTDLCNNYFTPYPKIDNPHRCYSGFGYGNQFYAR